MNDAFSQMECVKLGPGQISRNLELWGPANPEIWDPKNLKKMKVLKIQIRSAQNVGKVWISRKKSSWPHSGPSQAIFSMDWKNAKNAKNLPIFLGGPRGPIHPVWGVLVSLKIS